MARTKSGRGRVAMGLFQESSTAVRGPALDGWSSSMTRQELHWQSGWGQLPSLAGACSDGQQDEAQDDSKAAAAAIPPPAVSRTRRATSRAMARRSEIIVR